MKTALHLQGEDLVVAQQQDVEPILEFCKAQHNAGFHGSSEMRHVAEIPAIVVESYCQKAGITLHDFMSDQTHIRRILENPDNSLFRIWKGRL